MAQKAVTWDSELVSYSGEKGKTSSSNQTEATATVTQAKKPPAASTSAVVRACFLAVIIVTAEIS